MIFRLLAFVVFFGGGVSVSAAKTFVYCSEASPKIFNPQLATDGPTFNASSRTVYNRLLEFAPGKTEVVPSLAKSWKISKDLKTYTFELRPGVKFHSVGPFKPTRDFNADDVIFSFNRMRFADHPFHRVNGGNYEYFKSMGFDQLIKDIRKTDDHHVVFELTHPEAPFLADLAMDFASVLSAEYADYLTKQGKKEVIDLEPVGTGPFIFKKYVNDSSIRFEKNPDYFLGPAKIDQLVFSITPDSSVRYQKLKAGECHLIADPSPTDLESIRKDSNLQLIHQPGLNVGYVAMNVEKKPFDNVLVRQAIQHALNKESYINAIYLGNAVQAKGPLPPSMWGYNSKVKEYEYSPSMAQSLLSKAGYPTGFETELWVLPVSRPYNPNGKKMGELMQADLAKIGIKVKLVTYKWATYLEKASRGEHQMLQLGWTGDNGDPDNFLNVLLGCAAVNGGSNYARWCFNPFSELVEKARQISQQSQRSRLYMRAQQIFSEQVPWVPIAHATVFRALAKNVSGYRISPFGTENFYGLDIK